ncbi:hypothetical protein ES704_01764 [subsurface metagenome]
MSGFICLIASSILVTPKPVISPVPIGCSKDAPTKFDDLVEIMVKEDMNRWERWQKGERFPWDAPNYPNEAKILTRSLRV